MPQSDDYFTGFTVVLSRQMPVYPQYCVTTVFKHYYSNLVFLIFICFHISNSYRLEHNSPIVLLDLSLRISLVAIFIKVGQRVVTPYFISRSFMSPNVFLLKLFSLRLLAILFLLLSCLLVFFLINLSLKKFIQLKKCS